MECRGREKESEIDPIITTYDSRKNVPERKRRKKLTWQDHVLPCNLTAAIVTGEKMYAKHSHFSYQFQYRSGTKKSAEKIQKLGFGDIYVKGRANKNPRRNRELQLQSASTCSVSNPKSFDSENDSRIYNVLAIQIVSIRRSRLLGVPPDVLSGAQPLHDSAWRQRRPLLPRPNPRPPIARRCRFPGPTASSRHRRCR